MDAIQMSPKEITRLEAMQRVKDRRMSQVEAARQLGLSERQVQRLWRAYRERGAAGLVSKRRGRMGNHQLDAAVKRQALDLIEKDYRDFGPTLACEKLVEKHGLKISVESVRQLMIVEELWKPRKKTFHEGTSDARATGLPGGTGTDRWFGLCLVRRARTALYPTGDDR
jgi:transposase